MLKKEGGFYVLDNGQVAVRVPAEATTGELPGPIAGVRLGPGWKRAEISERHEMRRGGYWEFEAGHGWSPREGVGKPFSKGAGSGSVESVPPPNRPLRPIVHPSIRPDMYINLFPGFGVVFNNRPGTDRETYLSFKAGPNRGHYHGDQLAFHYCARARALAVDHHCSYNPRAGQEHMHNRLAFFTEELPYANMDGYERLIALKMSPGVDVAVGQIESNRLRQIEKLPPEIGHHEWPQQALEKPLVYRRTAVFVKGEPEDYFVFRDQFWSPIELGAAYCLHVHSDRIEQKGQTVDFGSLRLSCAAPAKSAFVSFPWRHENGPPESTQGARLEIRGTQGEFITVLYPGKPPAMEAIPGGVKVGGDEIAFAGDAPTAGDSAIHVTVKRGGKTVLALAGKDIDLDRSQGEIGLFVPDAGYPFGDIPEWLIRQRTGRPDWAKRAQ